MVFLQLVFAILSQFLHFIFLKIIDIFLYYKNGEYKKFHGYGFHIFIGLFGSGKTSTLVRTAYMQAKKYKEVRILTNMTLTNFPKWTVIEDLIKIEQIIQAPNNTIILIDEIATVFNARDWNKDGIPSELLEQFLQCRKLNKMMLFTVQILDHCDKQIRDISATVRDCICIAGRWNFVKVYNGVNYCKHKDNSMKPPHIRKLISYIQTNEIRNLYDTKEMVEKLKKKKFLSVVS